MHFQIGSDKVISKLVEDEAVIINLDNGIYYNLEGVSAVIWAALTTQVDLEDIRAKLVAQYPSQGDASAQLDALVAELKRQALLAEADGTPVPFDTTAQWPAEFSTIELIAYDDISDMVALDPPLPELS